MGQASDKVKQAAGEAAQSGFEAAKDATMSAADAAIKGVAEADLGGPASRWHKTRPTRSKTLPTMSRRPTILPETRTPERRLT